jgi:hypothetical protein
MVNIILLVLLWIGYNPGSMVDSTPPQNISNRKEIQGTWKTPSPRGIFEPVFTIIIDNREVFIYRYNPGSGGYKQLLTYKLEGNNIIAKEKEIIFFDQNMGNVTAHYKHRSNEVHLVWDREITPSTLVLVPAQPGSVMIKDSDSTHIDFKLKNEFSRLKKCPYFKSDY